MTDSTREIFLTFDVDWAPDAAIEATADLLRRAGVRSTWFVTHLSPAIERLRDEPRLFELGIHPNFLPESTHGDHRLQVLEHCLTMVPEARCLRTHALVQSSPLWMDVLQHTALRLDASLFLPGRPLQAPVDHSIADRTLLRVPYVWEDHYQLLQQTPRFDAGQILGLGPGLVVVGYHPIHVHLNSGSPEAYESLKARAGDPRWATAEQLRAHRGAGAGVGRMLEELVLKLASLGGGHQLGELVDRWDERKNGP